jgi:hypothetical protein
MAGVNSSLKRILKVGYVKATTWGTAMANTDFTSVDPLLVQELTGVETKRDIFPDESAGQGWEMNAVQGNDVPPTPSFTVYAYEDDEVGFLPLAQIYGADTVTNSLDPYTHTFVAQNEAGKFGTLAWQTGTKVHYIPSFQPSGITVSSINGQIAFEVTGKGDKITQDSDGTYLDTLNAAVPGTPFKFKNLTFRINAESGDALDADDAVAVSDLKVTMVRGSDSVITSGGGTIIQPKEGSFPEFKLEFTIPRKSTTAETLYAAFLAETTQKADIIISGSSANDSLSFFFPRLKIEACDTPFEDVIAVNVVCRVQKASANPNGMDNAVPYATWKTATSSSLL